MNFPPPAIGNIFSVKARLKQNPAPPVANQKVIFLLVGTDEFFWKKKKKILFQI